MIVLYDSQTGAELGTLDPAQFDFLTTQLEEESAADQDYYINRATIELFEQEGADAALIDLLRRALGSRDEMDIRWSER